MTLEELKLKKAELSERRNTLAADLATKQDARASLAFDAELGVESAKRQIAELTTAAAKLESELKTVDAALAECARRVSGAEAAERGEVERENARAALALLETFRKRGAALDAAFSAAIAEYVALSDEFRRLNALGFAPTTVALVKANMQRAAATKLMFTDLQGEFLAPHVRRDFVTSIDGWAAAVAARANATLNRKAVKAA